MSLRHTCAVALLAIISGAAVALPVNPWLADAPWPVSHQHPYAPGSSPLPGPASALQLGSPQWVDTGYINITLATSPRYPDGNRVYWGSNPAGVYKLAVVGGQLKKIATLAKPGNALTNIATPTSGAYTLVDVENTFYTVQGTTLLAYRDANPGQLASPITLARQVTIPSSIAADGDAIVGVNLLWDGNIAFATRDGKAGVISRDFTQVQGVTLGNGDEEVSNSIATDEQGGIYVVSSKAMYRVQWTGSTVSLDEATGAWRAEYNAGTAGAGGGRLGAGSGSTPTLMGSGSQKFVVITDGADVANLVLFWRDGIPAGWQPIAAGKDRRIAAERPVNFGNANRTATKSEQSVLVSGYGAVVVSNDYRNTGLLSGSTGVSIIDQMLNGLIVFNSGNPLHQPWGVQKFQWDTTTRTLGSAWVRSDVSCPNAIPTMSEATNRFYCVGAYLGFWTIESLDWTSGGNHFRKYIGLLPRYNSFYAATELTGDGGIIYGTYNGAVYLPKR